MVDYPPNYPRPEWQNYSGTINFGLIRSNVDAPLPNQIVSFNAPNMQMSLSFTGTNETMLLWSIWADANAWDWFNIELVNPRLTDAGSVSSTVMARFISDFTSTKLGDDWLRFTVQVEMVPGQAATGEIPSPIIPAFDQTQPGTVPIPSIYAIDPGTVASPSADTIGWDYSWPT